MDARCCRSPDWTLRLGTRLQNPDDRAIAPDSVFSLFSLTKAFTNILILRGIELGRFQLDLPGVVFSDPQTVFDKTIATVNDPVLGTIKMVGPILKSPDAPPAITRRPARASRITQAPNEWPTRIGRSRRRPATAAATSEPRVATS